MRTAMTLTARYCAKAKYEGDPNKKYDKDIRWHNDPVGLGLRVYESNAKSWVLQYTGSNGKQKLMTLAKYGVMTLEQAEKDAKVRLGKLHSSDQVDPLKEKQQRKAEADTDTTKQLMEAWITAKKFKRPESYRSTAEEYTYDKFGSQSWRTIQRSEVRAWHAKNGEQSKSAANIALANLRAAIYWRILQDDDASSDAPERRKYQRDTRNPCAGVQIFQLKARQVRIEPEDWPKFVKAIEQETSPNRHKDVVAGNGAQFIHNHDRTDPYVRAFFHVVIALGCRKSEARLLKWEDVRLAKPATVTFRGVKAKRGEVIDRTVPLSDYALKWLKGLEQQDGNPYVFCGFTDGQPLVGVNKAWERIRKRAGFPHVWIHDLRRTFGSWLGDVGFSEKQVGNVLGHKSDITGKVYMALSNKPKQFAVDVVGDFLTAKNAKKSTKKTSKKKAAAAVSFDGNGNVVPFQRPHRRRA
jgi:integrase